jgi:uncharacterized membrane protein
VVGKVACDPQADLSLRSPIRFGYPGPIGFGLGVGAASEVPHGDPPAEPSQLERGFEVRARFGHGKETFTNRTLRRQNLAGTIALCIKPLADDLKGALVSESHYHILLFIHILSSVVWVGGAALLQVLAFRAERSQDSTRIAVFAGEAEFVGTRVFLPTTLILLASGIWMVVGGPPAATETWIKIGIAIYALSALTGMLFLGPESKRIETIVEAKGATAPEAIARIKRIFVISRIEVLLLFFVVFDMTYKPFS